MMPAPATAMQHPAGAPFAMDVAQPQLDMLPHASSSHRRNSTDGDAATGSGSDEMSGSMDDYSDTGSSGSDDDSSEDEESLADRHAQGGSKRSASASDQSHPSKRRRSSSDSGGAGSDSNSSRKRRNLFPAVRRSQRCGNCHTCLNPQLKKACITMRERMMKEMQGPSSSKRSASSRAPAAAAAGAGSHQQQQLPLSPAGSADLDQDKYVDILAPLIDRSGGLVDGGSVGPFIQAMGSFKTTLSRVLPTSVLSLSRPSLLSDFMAAGGVDMLASWMLEAEGEDSEHAKTLLVDVLKLLQKLPVTKSFVSSTRSARVIGSLRKHRDPEVQQLAQQVVKQWMRVMPGKAGSSKPSSRPKPAGGSSAAAAGGSSLQSTAAKKATAQGTTGSVSSAGRAAGSQVQMVSDNDLFKPAAAAKPKTSLRLGMGQPKRSGGVQLMDSAEAGKLLSGTAATARSPAAGSKLLPSQRPRLPSPPLPGTAASAGAAAAAGPRVAVELKVTPEQMVAVTLRVIQPAGSRLPGLRRTGFGSSLGGRLGGASAGAGAGHSVGEAAAAPPQQPGVRKPRKRVSWQRELESVRWFVKEDPAVKAKEDAFLTEEQLRTLAQSHAHHQDFSSLIMMEHQAEKHALETHHREEDERRRAAVHAMQPGCPWHGVPPALQLELEGDLAFGVGQNSEEARRSQRPFLEVLHAMNITPFQQPIERPELQQPPPTSFNVAHHDRNMKLIPLDQQQQQQQVPPQQQPIMQQPQFGGPPVILQVPPPQVQQQQQQPVTYTLGQGMQSQPQLILQPIQQPQQLQVPQQQPQQQQPPASQPPAGAGGPPSSSDNAALLQVLQSLGGFLSQTATQQQQQPQVIQPVASQMQQQQQPPPQQMVQPAPLGLVPPPGAPPGQIVLMNGMHVLVPQGAAPLGAPPSLGAPPGLQLPPGFQLAPPQQQQPPGHPPVVIYTGGPPGVPPPGPPGVPPPGLVPGSAPPGHRLEDYSEFGPGGPGGPGVSAAGPWGGAPGPHGGPPGEYGGRHGCRGAGRGEGAGGPQRHGRGGRGGRGGPYHREHGGAAPWQGSTRICKFFNSARGCAKGDKCDFKHLNPGSDLDIREL